MPRSQNPKKYNSANLSLSISTIAYYKKEILHIIKILMLEQRFLNKSLIKKLLEGKSFSNLIVLEYKKSNSTQ